MKKTLIIFTLLLIVTLGFAIESTLTFKGGISRPEGDIIKDKDLNGMIGLSYEVWMTKWLSLGISPYVSRLESGPEEINIYETREFQTNLAGGNLLLRLRPTWKATNLYFDDAVIKRIAPFAVVGAGAVSYYPKDLAGNALPNTSDSDHPYWDFVAPAFGFGLTFFTKYDIDFDLAYQSNMMVNDYLDMWKTGPTVDAFSNFYLGVSHTFGKVKKVVEVEPVPVVEPVVEVPEPVLTVAPNSHKAGWQAGTAKTKIEANNPWNARTDSNWIRINPTSGNGNAMLNISYDENPGYEPRSGKIFISSADLNQVITVWQEGKPIPSLVLKPVFFEFDKYDLTDTAIATLDEVLASMAYYPDTQLLLSGNADEKGSLKYNQKLSEKRADAVKQYLISKGIAAERLSTIGYGKTKPIADNSTEEGRAQNRRTDLTLVK